MANPVLAPIAPGVTLGLSLFRQTQSTRLVPSDHYRTRLQSLQPVPDAPRRLFAHDTRVIISEADPTAATVSIIDQREVLRVAQPRSGHGPGTIAINPAAAPRSADYVNLYIGFGDGGGVDDPSGNAQDMASLFVKILRIDPAAGPNGEAYTIPIKNPHQGEGSTLGEIRVLGVRNPQQFSWYDSSGQMLIIDTRQSQLEEVNIGCAGGRADRCAKAHLPANDGSFSDPVAQFDHEEIFRSSDHDLAATSSAFAYTGSAVPELFGKVVLSELVSGRAFYFDAQPEVAIRCCANVPICGWAATAMMNFTC